jgi:hypothetical protein
MNTDIRISVSFKDHRKRKKLRSILGPGATDYLLDLWIAASVSRPSGVLTGLSEADIALDAGWPGEPGELVSALLECGFLEKKDGVYILHDWADHQGYVVHSEERKQRAKEAAAKRWNAKSKKDSCPEHANGMLTACPEHANGNAPLPAPTPAPAPTPVPTPAPVAVEEETPPPPNPAPGESEVVMAGEVSRGEAAALLAKIRPAFSEIWPEVQTGLTSDQMLTHVAEVAARVPEFRKLEAWRAAAQRARASPLLRGEKAGSQGRYFGHMNLAWFLKPDNLANILNGVYDEREAPRPPGPQDAENYNPVSYLSEARK